MIKVATIHGCVIFYLHPRLHFCKRYCSAFLEIKTIIKKLINKYTYKRHTNKIIQYSQKLFVVIIINTLNYLFNIAVFCHIAADTDLYKEKNTVIFTMIVLLNNILTTTFAKPVTHSCR